MTEINQIAQVTTTASTYDDIVALRTRLDVAMFNITMGNGTYGGADYQENGEMGFGIRKAELMRNLLEWRKQLTDDLKSPELLGEIVYQLSRIEGTHCSPRCDC